jgi:hypothetical protein
LPTSRGCFSLDGRTITTKVFEFLANHVRTGDDAMKSGALTLAAFLAVGIASVCEAQDLKATHRFSESQIGFDLGGSYGNYILTVTGPNGFHAIASSKTGTPAIDLRRFGTFDDGGYNYELTASTDEKVPTRSRLDDGRPGGPGESMLKGVSVSGRFDVKGGVIVKYDPAAREEQKRQK